MSTRESRSRGLQSGSSGATRVRPMGRWLGCRSRVSPREPPRPAAYEREEPGSVLAVYCRHHSRYIEEFNTIDEAVRFLESGEDYGSLSSEAVVDGERIICGDELDEMRWAVSDWNRSASPHHH